MIIKFDDKILVLYIAWFTKWQNFPKFPIFRTSDFKRTSVYSTLTVLTNIIKGSLTPTNCISAYFSWIQDEMEKLSTTLTSPGPSGSFVIFPQFKQAPQEAGDVEVLWSTAIRLKNGLMQLVLPWNFGLVQSQI